MRFEQEMGIGSCPCMMRADNSNLRWSCGLLHRKHCLVVLPLVESVTIVSTRHLTPLLTVIGWKKEAINLIDLEGSYKVCCLVLINFQRYRAKHLWSR